MSDFNKYRIVSERVTRSP